MKTQMVITDLTRMHHGRVCIAGYTGKRECIRPVLPPPGIPESSLFQQGKAIIYPFSLVELDLISQISESPHTEDWLYDLKSTKYIRDVKSRKEVLEWSLFESLDSLFDQPIYDDLGYYVMSCQGPRSLGTVRPTRVQKVIYKQEFEDAWDYRMIFHDRAGASYRLKITDLTWHFYCDSLRDENLGPQEIANELTTVLHSREIFLRIGLARGWEKFPDRCFLQITGVYTFPDYLDGKNFADLAPARSFRP